MQTTLKSNFTTVYHVCAFCSNALNPICKFIFVDLINPSFPIHSRLYHAQVVEEMLDNGFPMITEPNILMQMIEPPSNVRVIEADDESCLVAAI